MCNKCNCKQEIENPCFKDCCKEEVTCDDFLSTSCIYYRLENRENSKLYSIRAENGTPLNTVLELFDKKFQNLQSASFDKYTLPYLQTVRSVKTIKDFAETVSLDLGNKTNRIKGLEECCATSTNSLNILSTEINAIKNPKIVDINGIGFTINSTIQEVLQALANNVKTNSSNSITETPITPINSNSIVLSVGGVNNHTIKADAVLSTDANNLLEKRSNGLYVSAPSIANQIQNLAINQNTLSISGGNSVTLPLQTLSLSGSNLSISGGNSVNLSSLITNAQTPLICNSTSTINATVSGVNNHTLNLSAKISTNAGNKLNDSNGLFVEETKALTILQEINSSALTSAERNLLCQVIKNSCNTCFTYHVRNTSGTDQNFGYAKCSDGSLGNVLVQANNYVTVNGVSSVLTNPTPSNGLVITNMGLS